MIHAASRRVPTARRVLAALAVPLALCAAPAFAQVACTNINTVQISSSPLMNNEYGGHLNAHIRGQIPPPGFTQYNRTLFRDAQDWNEAYNALAAQNPPLYCAQNPQPGAEAARDLPIQFFSYQCTAANAAGVCTAGREIQTNTVRVVMRFIDRRWVLYTAYPIPR